MGIGKILKVALFTPGPRGLWGLPIYFTGDPGTGKTSVIEQYALQYGLAYIPVIASLREPADFLGLPTIAEGSSPGSVACKYAPPDWAVQACEVKHALVFIDEANQVAPATQGSLMRVTLERVVGELSLPPTVRILLAGNATEDVAGSYDMNMALANRLGHMNWRAPSVDEWCDWMIGSDGLATSNNAELDPEEEEAAVLAAWPRFWSGARGAITAFIRKRADLLAKKPNANTPDASKAWPSRRSWEMAARVLAGAALHDASSAETETMLESFIGHGAAAEFLTWRAEQDLPDSADVLDGKHPFKHDKKRLDRSLAVLSSCAALVVPESAKKRADRAKRLWEILADVADSSADLVVSPCRQMVGAGLIKYGDASSVMKRLTPVLRAAGITYQGK